MLTPDGGCYRSLIRGYSHSAPPGQSVRASLRRLLREETTANVRVVNPAPGMELLAGNFSYCCDWSEDRHSRAPGRRDGTSLRWLLRGDKGFMERGLGMKGWEFEAEGRAGNWGQGAGGKGFEKRGEGRFLARQMLTKVVNLTVFKNL